ncbi:HAMP domain-containing histidine kinase, partial [Candidatus Daviesbacteria bacterium]|nr:HAMP domain-containing histidine kinase [Candidatus Daviesbacteria bacterium]
QREYKKGLGVGLFITSQIVKMHSGKIKVSSAPAKGTSFTIELPLRE